MTIPVPARLLLLAAAACAIGCGDEDAALREPTQIATGQASPGPIVADAAGVHWVNAGDGAVMSLLSGAASATKLATVEGGASDATTDDNRIFWTTAGGDGAIGWVDRHSAEVHELASGEGRLSAIALDETCVFWASDTGAIRTIWKDGGPIASVAEDQASPVGLARDLSGIFWLAGSGETVVRRAKQVGDPATDAADVAGTAGQLVVKNGEMFWTVTTASGGTGVWRANADGQGARQLTEGFAAPVAFAVGPAAVYWADASAGLWKAPLDGGEAEQMAALPRPAADLAFSSDVLYGSDPGAGAQDGTIWQLSVVP